MDETLGQDEADINLDFLEESEFTDDDDSPKKRSGCFKFIAIFLGFIIVILGGSIFFLWQIKDDLPFMDEIMSFIDPHVETLSGVNEADKEEEKFASQPTPTEPIEINITPESGDSVGLTIEDEQPIETIDAPINTDQAGDMAMQIADDTRLVDNGHSMGNEVDLGMGLDDSLSTVPSPPPTLPVALPQPHSFSGNAAEPIIIATIPKGGQDELPQMADDLFDPNQENLSHEDKPSKQGLLSLDRQDDMNASNGDENIKTASRLIMPSQPDRPTSQDYKTLMKGFFWDQNLSDLRPYMEYCKPLEKKYTVCKFMDGRWLDEETSVVAQFDNTQNEALISIQIYGKPIQGANAIKERFNRLVTKISANLPSNQVCFHTRREIKGTDFFANLTGENDKNAFFSYWPDQNDEFPVFVYAKIVPRNTNSGYYHILLGKPRMQESAS